MDGSFQPRTGKHTSPHIRTFSQTNRCVTRVEKHTVEVQQIRPLLFRCAPNARLVTQTPFNGHLLLALRVSKPAFGIRVTDRAIGTPHERSIKRRAEPPHALCCSPCRRARNASTWHAGVLWARFLFHQETKLYSLKLDKVSLHQGRALQFRAYPCTQTRLDKRCSYVLHRRVFALVSFPGLIILFPFRRRCWFNPSSFPVKESLATQSHAGTCTFFSLLAEKVSRWQDFSARADRKHCNTCTRTSSCNNVCSRDKTSLQMLGIHKKRPSNFAWDNSYHQNIL